MTTLTYKADAEYSVGTAVKLAAGGVSLALSGDIVIGLVSNQDSELNTTMVDRGTATAHVAGAVTFGDALELADQGFLVKSSGGRVVAVSTEDNDSQELKTISVMVV